MVWRRVLVPSSFTLRELQGVIQVAMGWEGIHLYEFHIRAARYGSWELSASSPDITLAALRLRNGARFIYEYDLNIPWRHEVRIEDRLGRKPQDLSPLFRGWCLPARGLRRSGKFHGPPRRQVLVRCPGGPGHHGQRFSSGSWRRMARRPLGVSIKRHAGGWKRPLSGQRRARWPRDGRFRGGGERQSARRRAPQSHAPAVVICSARRCASKSAATKAASSPRCCRMPEINAWAVGSVSWSNLRCSVAAVVSA